MLGVLIGLAAGVAMPLQTSVNGKLGDNLKSPYISTMVSFTGGIILALCIVFATSGSIAIPFSTIAKEPLWIWMGGFCGTVLVLISIICLPVLGSTETMVIYVLGQIFTGLVIDTFGLFKTDAIPLTAFRIAGIALVFAGSIIVAVANAAPKASAEKEEKPDKPNVMIYRIGIFISGVLAAIQIAVNGRLGQVTGHPFKATAVSMLVGFISIAIIIAALCIFKGGTKGIIDDKLPGGKVKWWMCTGGVFAMIIVGGNVVIAQTLGAGLSLILNVTGQTLGGIVVDATGFLGIEKKPVTVKKIAAVLLMIAGIALVKLF